VLSAVTCVPEGLQYGFDISLRPLQDPDCPFQRAFTALGNFNDQECKQTVTNVFTGDLCQQTLQAAAVLLGVDRQQIRVRIGIVEYPGNIDFFAVLSHSLLTSPLSSGSNEPQLVAISLIAWSPISGQA
jgi:hypothetical protein